MGGDRTLPEIVVASPAEAVPPLTMRHQKPCQPNLETILAAPPPCSNHPEICITSERGDKFQLLMGFGGGSSSSSNDSRVNKSSDNVRGDDGALSREYVDHAESGSNEEVMETDSPQVQL